MVHARCERAGFQVLFSEIRCDDPHIIEANIRSTKLSSPDYEDTDPDEAVTDFRARIAHYQRVYQPLDDDEGAYLRVTGAGRGVTVSNVDGYLAARLVFFLMNLHLTARPIWLTRHGESVYNAAGLLGGDPDLTPDGHRYARSLAEFLDRRYPDRNGVAIWTSSLRRAVQTATPLGRTPWAWRALDEIDGGICDSMSHAQIQERLLEEYAAQARQVQLPLSARRVVPGHYPAPRPGHHRARAHAQPGVGRRPQRSAARALCVFPGRSARALPVSAHSVAHHDRADAARVRLPRDAHAARAAARHARSAVA
jgi:hypothetical protein